MDIICKCGHDIKEHTGNSGCWQVYGDNKTTYVCDCDLTCYDVAFIFATEQQARLDTNRAQVTALIAERDALKEKNERLASFLRIYANSENWTSDNSFLFPSNNFDVPEHVPAYSHAEMGLKLND